MSFLSVGNWNATSLEIELSRATLVQENQLGDSILGNRLVRHIDGSLKTISKTPAEVVGERVIRPLVDTVFDLSSRSFHVLKSGFSFLDHIFSKACNFLPMAKASPISSTKPKQDIVLQLPTLNCSNPISSAFEGTGVWNWGEDAKGNVIAGYRDDNYKFIAAMSLPAEETVWTSPSQLSPPDNLVSYLITDVNARGDAIAIWDNWDLKIFEQSTLSAGEKWTPFVNLSDWFQPNMVTLYPNGDAISIWRTCCSTDTLIQTSILSSGKDWTIPVNVGNSKFAVSQDPIIALDANGNAVAAWLTDTVTLQAATLPLGKSWTQPVTLATIDALPSQDPIAKFQLAVSDNGNALAVLYNLVNPAGFNNTLQASMLLFGETWSSPFTISTCSTIVWGCLNADNVQVAIDTHGNGIVIWTGRSRSLQISAHPLGGIWTPPFNLTAYDPSIAITNVAITIDQKRNAFAVWTYDSGGRFGHSYSLMSATCSLLKGTCTAPIQLVYIGETLNWGPTIKFNSANLLITWAGFEERSSITTLRCSPISSSNSSDGFIL